MMSFSGCGKKEVIVDEGKGQSYFKQETLGRIGDNVPISRGMVAKMIAIAFDDKEVQIGKGSFSDVKEGRWNTGYIEKAVALGFMDTEKEKFFPQRAVTLQEAQKLVERLNPDFKNKIKITEQTEKVPISYSLWVELFQDALAGRRAEGNVSSYGIQEKSLVILEAEEGQPVVTQEGEYTAKGYGVLPFTYEKIRVLEKDHEILAVLELEEEKAHLENVYLSAKEGQVTLDTGFQTRIYPLKEGDSTTGEGVGNLLLVDGTVEAVTFSASIGGGIIRKMDEKGVFIEGKGYFSWDGGPVFLKTEVGICKQPISKLIVGSDVADFYEKDGKLAGALLLRKTMMKNIRVVLGNSQGEGYFHQKVSLFAKGGLVMKNGVESKEWNKSEPLVFLSENSSAFFRDGYITVESKDGSPIAIQELQKDGKTLSYEGFLQLEKRKEGYVIVNDIPLERYLCGVLLYEMPVSFGIEPLKAQAITARSYAFNQFYTNRYAAFGANVDDSTACQVYGGVCGDKTVEQAVLQTEGICLAYGNKVVSGNFYSTSCGVTADAGEVWATDNGKTFPSLGKPYLVSRKQGLQKEWGDFSKEETMTAFLKNGPEPSYDMTSPWYRWQTSFDGVTLKDVLGIRLQQVFKEYPNLVLGLDSDGVWHNRMPEDLGKILDITVLSRGKGGNALSMVIKGEKGQVRLITELVVRNVLKPTGEEVGKSISLMLQDGSIKENSQLLPSSFFVLEQKKGNDGFLEELKIYGGGSGHGVGMSQYGAYGLAQKGKKAEEILEHYFVGAKVAKVFQ